MDVSACGSGKTLRRRITAGEAGTHPEVTAEAEEDLEAEVDIEAEEEVEDQEADTDFKGHKAEDFKDDNSWLFS